MAVSELEIGGTDEIADICGVAACSGMIIRGGSELSGWSMSGSANDTTGGEKMAASGAE